MGHARRQQGLLYGALSQVGFPEQKRVYAESIIEEALETSEIEGDSLNHSAVRSSVAKRLGLADAGVAVEDAKADGIVAVTLDATQGHAEPLTLQRLHTWHRMLFPLPPGNRLHIGIGQLREDAKGPMQVVSGRIDQPKVHFQAPPAQHLNQELQNFLVWFNATSLCDGLLRTAIAHLWFVTLHPYDDGNGRIARAVADMALAQDELLKERFFGMSRQIRLEKSRYYAILEQTQSGTLNITEWLQWFLSCYLRAAEHAQAILADVLLATRFWNAHHDIPFSARQKLVLNRFLNQFEGKLTAKKWASLAKTSIDTAQRDIGDLIDKDVLTKNNGGSKNTSYDILHPKPER